MSALVISLAITVVILLLTWLWIRRDPRAPPGPIGLPLLGSLLSLNPKAAHHSLKEIADKYGKNGACELFLGSIRTVLLTDPKLIREAFAKDVFAGRAPLFLTHGIMQGLGIICAEGELWKDQRRLLSVWMRSLGAAKTSTKREILEQRIAHYVDKLEEKLALRSDKAAAIDIHAVLADITGNLINNLMYGASYREDDETWRWLLQVQEDAVKFMGVAAVVNFMPYLRFISKSIRESTAFIIAGQTQSHTILRTIVELRRNRRRKMKGESIDILSGLQEMRCISYGLQKEVKVHFFKPSNLIVSDEDCILDYYLEEQEKRLATEPESEATCRLSDKQLVFLLADLFGAGLDTTLTTLCWFLLFIAINKDEQETMRQELTTVCGGRAATLEDLPRLSYSRAAIAEAQRMRPVVPLGVPHGCLQDTTLGEYRIKRGSMVVPLQWALHMDSEAWEDPAVFRPARFLEPDGNLRNPSHFIPFQMGKRICPGDELARMILFQFGSRLVQNYELDLDGQISSLDGIIGITLTPPPFKLILRPVQH